MTEDELVDFLDPSRPMPSMSDSRHPLRERSPRARRGAAHPAAQPSVLALRPADWRGAASFEHAATVALATP